MAYATQRDRTPEPLERTGAPTPAAPLNAFVSAAGTPGALDIWWDDPSILGANKPFDIFGVNIYRSFDSEFGPYDRVNDLPLGSRYWRDQTDNVLIPDEDVTHSFILHGPATAGMYGVKYVFRTLQAPIVKEGSQLIPANDPRDVRVYVDGVEARVLAVYGQTGEVELDPKAYPDVSRQKLVPAVLPTHGSKVTCAYRYNRSFVRTDLVQRIFYRLTTVGTMPPSTELVETPLENAICINNYSTEKIDWIWREAIRRNAWILDQGGERVKVFIRKQVGQRCPCYPPGDVHGQPISDCFLCTGVGILGGYSGPFDLIIAPDDAEKRISQKETGRTVEHTYEVFTGPVPILQMRDFIVKLNGERYSIGPVRQPTNRGAVLQQHFTIGHIDEKDIRHKVPLEDPTKYAMNMVAQQPPEQRAPAGRTDNPDIPEERQLRGETETWGNTTY